MCCIFAAFTKNKVVIDKNISPLRGPDDWGVSYNVVGEKCLTLFQSRLSIIGLGEQGHQPYCKRDSAVLIFNGEIYNYQKLRAELEATRNVCFDTSTDTEVLYEALAHWSLSDVLEKLNGIFAFSYYDVAKHELIVVRDHLGVKPVYYYHDEDKFFFASEAKIFFELNLLEPCLNRELLGEYFANGWIYEPDTLFKNIFKLPAASYARINLDNNAIKIDRYWSFNQKSGSIPDLSAVINDQTISDVPIGLYFSGGVDSSILAHDLKNQDVLDLNLCLDDSESERVKMMEKAFSLNVKKIYSDSQNLYLYRELIYAMDEPIADAAMIPAFQLAKAAKHEGRVVMLSGMGGDEIDAGYTRHKILARMFYLKLVQPLTHCAAILFKGKIKRDLLRLSSFLSCSVPENYFSLTSYLNKKEIDSLVGQKWYEKYSVKIKSLCKGFKGKKQFFALDMKGFLASHNLIYMDKASMAASVEVRVPLLDKNIVQHYFQQIDKPFLAGKKRLQTQLKKRLGNKYKKVQKQGFRYPVEKWVQQDINWSLVFNFMEDNKIINITLPKKWLDGCCRHDVDDVQKLWLIYTLYLWLHEFKVNTTN